MGATSLNGWPVLTAGDKRLVTRVVPGTAKSITCRDVVMPLLLAVEIDINAKVIPISGGYGPDGWQLRQAHAASGYSNHASGTAIDNRYDVFPADHQQHASAAQIKAMHTIMDKYVTSGGKRVLGWGGDWTVGRYCDSMHIEIGQAWQPGVGSPVTAGDVQNVIARLGIQPDGTTTPPVMSVGAITGLHAFLVGPGRVHVSWDPTPGADAWEVTNSRFPTKVPPMVRSESAVVQVPPRLYGPTVITVRGRAGKGVTVRHGQPASYPIVTR